MNELKKEVIRWWHSGRSHEKGIRLFARVTKNRTLLQTFQKKHPRYTRRKLQYELTKAVGLNWKKMPAALPNQDSGSSDPEAVLDRDHLGRSAAVKSAKSATQNNKAEKLSPGLNKDHEPGDMENRTLPPLSFEKDPSPVTGQMPRVIRRLKHEYRQLYTNRSLLHKKMRETPQENSSVNVETRATLLKQIKALSAKMDFLYSFLEAYHQQGTVPVAEQIWPGEKKKQLPQDPVLLKKKKKNLQSANTKDRNILKFQGAKKLEAENPMPRGPKRQRIEARIKNREREIQEIEQKIVDLEHAGKTL